MARRIDALLPLQTMDIEIHKFKVARTAKPRDLAAIEDKLARAKGNLAAMHEEIKLLKLDVQKRETSVKEFDDKIQKLTNQSMGAKKNEEYQIFLKEISGVKADKSRVEDGMLDLMFQLDEKGKLEKVREGELKAVEAEHAVAKKKLEGEIAQLDVQLKEMSGRRAEAIQGLEKDVLASYERVQRAKDDGMALVQIMIFETVEDKGILKYEGCGGCHVEINKQMVNEAKKGRDIVFCNACSRILFWKDEPKTVST